MNKKVQDSLSFIWIHLDARISTRPPRALAFRSDGKSEASDDYWKPLSMSDVNPTQREQHSTVFSISSTETKATDNGGNTDHEQLCRAV